MKPPTLKRAKERAWKAMSEYIRWRDYPGCYTCEAVGGIESMHAGHYIHGRLDYDEMNIHAQCVRCNVYLHGNLGVYAERLIKDHGQEAVDDLRKRANERKKYNVDELLVIEAEYKAKLLEIKARKGL
jgi:hypothetical protein